MHIEEKAKRDLRIAAAMIAANHPSAINVLMNVAEEMGGTPEARRAAKTYVNRILNRANPDRRTS